ncbi:hypothetical protein PV-S19_0109 [Pacmanvirus S19]|nr:hypothetical protein PV-S19_0109 [Pacmanvirus S19]
MQNNIVHKLLNAPTANEEIPEPEAFVCVVCRCFHRSNGEGIYMMKPAFFGQYLYTVQMQVPDYPYMNIASVCSGCHSKVQHNTEHMCSGCEYDDRGSCKKIMDYLQGQDWEICVYPECRYCIKPM